MIAVAGAQIADRIQTDGALTGGRGDGSLVEPSGRRATA